MGLTMHSYRNYDVTDFAQREALMEQIDADKAESLADLERRRLERPVETWAVPQPEPVQAAVRPSNDRQMHGAEWAAHTRDFATAAVASMERKLKARQDRMFENLIEAMGKVVAHEREQHRADIEALKAEIATLKASEERVIDMRGHLRGGQRAA
jgi:hypothetical protein